MPLSEAQRKAQYNWQKKGTVMIAARLQRKADADIIAFLEDKPNATIIKAALREYMKNHSSASSASSEAQPAEEEEDDDDWLEMYMNAISPNHPDNEKKIN